MRLSLKKITILSLVIALIISASMCCCFADLFKVKKLAMSCHQTTHETDSSNSSDNECGCEKYAAVIKDAVIMSDVLVQSMPFDVGCLVANQTPIVSNLLAYQAPPDVYDTTRLYIKYSILRV